MNLGIEIGRPRSPVANELTPEVGMGVTIYAYSDRYAGTIHAIRGSVLVVTEDDAKRVDRNGMSECQEYEFTPNPNNRLHFFKKNRKGMWVKCEYNNGRFVLAPRSYVLRLGVRSRYYNFSF